MAELTARLFMLQGDLSDYLEERKKAVSKEIQDIKSEYLFSVNEEELIAHLIGKYILEAPILKEENLEISKHEEMRPDYGLNITISVPFSGNPWLFHYKPNLYTSRWPRGTVEESSILIKFHVYEYDEEKVRRELQEILRDINWYLDSTKGDINVFNKDLEALVRGEVKSRKAKLQKDLSFIEKLGIPLRRYDEVPKTFSVPALQKKIRVPMPEPKKATPLPDPTMNMDDYDEILKILQSMSVAIERSPRTFRKLSEEELRDLFLVALNGHFKGNATGETFNYTGKTDILIRYKDKNLFIAECKFWDGEKKLLDTIDQLLGYKSWRDTKTAILLFNKNQRFSSVLEKIPEAVKKHSCFKKEIGKAGETTSRYVFHHLEDSEREFILTIMAFDIPSGQVRV